MKYALFLYAAYYPNGGTADLVGVFDTPEAAMDAALNYPESWDGGEIVDSDFNSVRDFSVKEFPGRTDCYGKVTPEKHNR